MEESPILDESLSHENGFRLDQGFCYFTTTGLDIRNNRFSFSSSHKAGFLQWFYGIILPVILISGNGWLAYLGFMRGNNISVYLAICCWVLYAFFFRIALRPPKIAIEKNSIISIKHISAIRFLSKGYFVFRYLKNGNERRTVLILPGVFFKDKQETEKAIRLLNENNYTIQ
ncbi:MAG: hypothetical protein WCI97_06905 [Bacteroidota bacterium]